MLRLNYNRYLPISCYLFSPRQCADTYGTNPYLCKKKLFRKTITVYLVFILSVGIRFHRIRANALSRARFVYKIDVKWLMEKPHNTKLISSERYIKRRCSFKSTPNRGIERVACLALGPLCFMTSHFYPGITPIQWSSVVATMNERNYPQKGFRSFVNLKSHCEAISFIKPLAE